MRTFKINNYKIYRIFPSGEVQYLHPKDGVFPEIILSQIERSTHYKMKRKNCFEIGSQCVLLGISVVEQDTEDSPAGNSDSSSFVN